MQHLLNVMKAQAAAMDAARGQPRWGIVTNATPDYSLVQVMIQPENTLSGWLPVVSPWAGSGWGLHAPLWQGAQVLVLPDSGDAEHGVVIGASWNAQDQPPQGPAGIGGDPSYPTPGELLLVSQAGAVVRLCADGSVYIKGPLNLEGDLTVQGNVAFSGGTLTHDGTDVSSTHRHGGVTPGGGDTGTPIGETTNI